MRMDNSNIIHPHLLHVTGVQVGDKYLGYWVAVPFEQECIERIVKCQENFSNLKVTLYFM